MPTQPSALAGCRALVALTALPLIIAVVGCGQLIPGIRGSGTIVTESREVSGSASVSLSGIGHVVLRQGDSESLEITADDNLLPLLTSDVSDGTLYLGIKNNAQLRPTEPIQFDVTAELIEELRVSGAGNFRLEQIEADKLTISISGAGDVSATGTVTELTLKVTGAGDFDGAELVTSRTEIRGSGATHAVVNVTDDLKVDISGAGDVEFIGSPTVEKSVRGVGSVRQRQ